MVSARTSTSLRQAVTGALALWLVATHSLSAQDRVAVSFAAGASSAEINGTITGHEYIDYIVNARGGQEMVVSLAATGTNGHGSAFFNILPADLDFGGPYIGSEDDDRRAEVIVPRDGDWAIRVYLLGNDKDANRTVGYSINVFIGPGSGGSSGSSASGPDLLPEEDIFVVRLSDANGRLNIRDAPRPSARLVGTLANGVSVANVGGCTISDGRQWCEIQAESGGLRGWASARYLALPRLGAPAPAPPPAASGEVVTIWHVPPNDILNVRAGPGTGSPIVGALGNGDRVVALGCETRGQSRWCQIEMLTDMQERGWINARYISGHGATAPAAGASGATRISFGAGTAGTEFSERLGPETSVGYLLGAMAGQDLYLRVASSGTGVAWRLLNPDGSLLDEGTAAKGYRGQLWQSGDHRIEVSNRGGGPERFNVIVGVE
ncbi:SH3 domain-containing protein [Palleronia pelagia]|uniref:SH3 domain-containing protein n=1 Tax=Palleronia pelagia TaxID=387096 RepID=A0A1H8DJH3_9RHOB|nr:SH3 domain-containing protein [Palleronia pelagia]SEN07363.1 SH3 domain-containing protein [Palleronia pelagia]